jgi:hypothetical protein
MTNHGWTIPEVYTSRKWDLDECPECGGPKTKHGSMCIACRRRIGRASRPLAERFWEKVDRSVLDGCWPFLGARDPDGYGRVMVGRDRRDKANRVAYMLTSGPIPDGLQVLHRCDNPPCCNPAHLFAGTPLDNMRDMIAKGRAAWQKSA